MPKKVKPVLAWCVLHDGVIYPSWCVHKRGVARIRQQLGVDYGPIIRVEIRPAPKRSKTQRRRK